jgi:DNA-binding XRE family transcriptional regulator
MKQFKGRLITLGMKEEYMKDTLQSFSHNLTLSDFDGGYLKPQQFFEFCSYIYINPKKLYDSYYSYVFSDYGSAFIKFRKKHNLTQKQLASIIRVSPVDLGLFEKGIRYPTRCQFSKISRVLMKLKDT